jgi:hypothetical protein
MPGQYPAGKSPAPGRGVLDHVLVGDLLWADVAGYFEPDGSLLDVYVFDVNNSDWQLVLDAVRSQTWRLEYIYDGSARPLPHDVGEIFRHRCEASTCLHIWPAPNIMVNSHFFSEDEIEFDFDPGQFHGQDDLDVMCAFVHLIGTALHQLVYVTPENTPDRALLIYDPSLNRVTAAPSPATHTREDAESA